MSTLAVKRQVSICVRALHLVHLLPLYKKIPPSGWRGLAFRILCSSAFWHFTSPPHQGQAASLKSFSPSSSFFLHTRTARTKLVKAEDEDRLVDLESQDLRLDERQRLAVDLDEALAGLAVGDGGGSPLLAEALHALGGRRHVGWLLGRSCRG